MRYVDISSVCNAKWINRENASAEGIEGANLSASYLSDGKIEGEGFSFLPPSSDNDIIICRGQFVTVGNVGNIKYADIAGFAVFGQTHDNFAFEYTDGTSDKHCLGFRDVANMGLDFSQFMFSHLQAVNPCGKTIMKFEFVQGENRRYGKIFAHRIQVSKGKILAGILLPDNFFINICGITLGE